jgi:hypothetical protein
MNDFEKFQSDEGERVMTRPTEGSVFLSQLSERDLIRLREVVKRVYMKFYPVEFFTDREADKMIESLAPSTVERLIKAHVDGTLYGADGKTIHRRVMDATT